MHKLLVQQILLAPSLALFSQNNASIAKIATTQTITISSNNVNFGFLITVINCGHELFIPYYLSQEESTQ